MPIEENLIDELAATLPAPPVAIFEADQTSRQILSTKQLVPEWEVFSRNRLGRGNRLQRYDGFLSSSLPE